MERETRMLLWTIFGIGVLTVAAIPAAWGSLNHQTATGVVSNKNMAQVLWGQSQNPSPYVEQWSQNTGVPIIPGAVSPHITSVTWDTFAWIPQLVISGDGFGNSPTTGDGQLTVVDTTRDWSAANDATSGVQPTIRKWSNEGIVVSGFSGGYGQADIAHWSDGLGAWVFAPGDSIQITVVNPQTGNRQTTRSTFPANAPIPKISMNAVEPMMVGRSQSISGQVSFDGQALANQSVAVSVSGGALGGTAFADNPSEHVVDTDAQGDFSIPYTATDTAGLVTVTLQADGQTAHESIQVYDPVPMLQVSTTSPYIDQNVQLTATCNDLPPGIQLAILKSLSGTEQILDQSPNSPLTMSETEHVVGVVSYTAAVLDKSGHIVTKSAVVQVSWQDPYTVTLVATADRTDNTVTLTATSNEPLNGHTMEIINKTTGQVVVSTTRGTTLTTQVTALANQTQDYVAVIES